MASFISLGDIKNYAGITTTAQDALLTGWSEIVCDEIERYTGHAFSLRTITGERHDGSGTPFLFPSVMPANGLAGNSAGDLQWLPSGGSVWQNVVTSPAEVSFISGYAVQILRGVFPAGKGNIRINYSAGMAAPGAIRRIAMEMTQMLWNESKQGGDWLGRESRQSPEGGSARHTVFRDLRPEWRSVLDTFRRVQV